MEAALWSGRRRGGACRDLARAAGLGALAIGIGLGLACGSDKDTSPGAGAAVPVAPAAAAEAKPALPDPVLWETALEDPQLEAGRQVWVGTCIACHSTGLGGAPLIGNETLWGPRIAKGLDVLVQHATEGFYGDVGEMPARGGNDTLSDEEVAAAVRFMASRAMEL